MSKDKIGIVGRMLIKATSYVTGINLPATRSSLNILRQFVRIGSTPVYTNWNDRDYVNKGLLVNPSLYAIVNRITSKAATVPFSAYKIKNASKAERYKSFTSRDATPESLMMAMQLKSEAYELDDKHPINELLEHPNEWQRQSEFIQTCIGFKLLTGERFLLLTKVDLGANAGKVATLVNLPPQGMVVIPGEGLYEILHYQLQIGTTPVPIPKELVIFSRDWNPQIDISRSHLRGLSPLRAAAKLLDRMDAAQDRAAIMLQNAGASGILFNKVLEGYSESQRNELKRILNTEIMGMENTASIHVGQGDLGYIPFGISATDMELLEQERFTIEQLCNIYRTPSGLFIETNPTDNNVREWKKQMFSDAVIPALSDMRDDYNEIAKLYPDEVFVDFDITAVPEMQEDINITAARLEKMPYMKLNEKRLAVGLDEDLDNPMMDQYLFPSSVKDLRDLDPANIDREMERVDREFEREQLSNESGKDNM